MGEFVWRLKCWRLKCCRLAPEAALGSVYLQFFGKYLNFSEISMFFQIVGKLYLIRGGICVSSRSDPISPMSLLPHSSSSGDQHKR